jgi:large subunit ribosomal protein L25
MPEITLVAESGRPVGSRPAGRLRAIGRVPAVLYGHGMEPLPISVEARALRTALTSQAGLNALLSLKIDGKSHLAMARALQRHPVRNTVLHVDFQVVRRDEVMSVEVPITLTGEATAVHREDGLVNHLLFSLTVNATPDRIPPHLEIDISDLNIGDTIRVGDLVLPEGVTTDVNPDEAVVVGQSSTLAAEAEAAEAEAAEAAAEAAAEEAATAAPEAAEAGAEQPGAPEGAAGGGSEPGGTGSEEG